MERSKTIGSRKFVSLMIDFRETFDYNKLVSTRFQFKKGRFSK